MYRYFLNLRPLNMALLRQALEEYTQSLRSFLGKRYDTTRIVVLFCTRLFIECSWYTQSPGCVLASNIAKYADKTLEECRALCRDNSMCLAVEYYHYHGGDKNRPNDCWLQDSTESSWCDGKTANFDLHVKENCTTGIYSDFVATYLAEFLARC